MFFFIIFDSFNRVCDRGKIGFNYNIKIHGTESATSLARPFVPSNGATAGLKIEWQFFVLFESPFKMLFGVLLFDRL